MFPPHRLSADEYALFEEAVLALAPDGLSTNAMGKTLGVNPDRVARVLKRNGLNTNRRGTAIIDKGNGLVQCSKCARLLFKEDLPWGRKSSYPYQLSYCKQCKNYAASNNRRSSIPIYLKHRQYQLKSRAMRDGIEYSLPEAYLFDLWTLQGGLCFYTDVPMEMYDATAVAGPRANSVSVDKIVPELGYVPGNVVLCVARVNSMKNDCTLDEMAEWMPGWFDRITRYSQKVGSDGHDTL